MSRRLESYDCTTFSGVTAQSNQTMQGSRNKRSTTHESYDCTTCRSRGNMGKITQFRGWFSNIFLNVESPTAPIEGSRTSRQTRVCRCVETVRLILCRGDFVQQRFTCNKCCWTNSNCFLFNNIFQQYLHLRPQERLNFVPESFEFVSTYV